MYSSAAKKKKKQQDESYEYASSEYDSFQWLKSYGDPTPPDDDNIAVDESEVCDDVAEMKWEVLTNSGNSSRNASYEREGDDGLERIKYRVARIMSSAGGRRSYIVVVHLADCVRHEFGIQVEHSSTSARYCLSVRMSSVICVFMAAAAFRRISVPRSSDVLLPRRRANNLTSSFNVIAAGATDESLWKWADFGNKRLTEPVLHSLLHRGMRYARLAKAQIISTKASHPEWDLHYDVGSSFAFNGADLDVYALQYLDLSMTTYEEPFVVNAVLAHCRHLIALSVEGCLVDDVTCVLIGQNRHLLFLNMALCQQITSAGIKAIVSGCQELQELNVGWTNMNHCAVEYLCRHLPQSLQRINLSGCRSATLFDVDVAHLVVNCPLVTEIDISDCTDLSAATINIIIKGCAVLERLSCSRCYKIDPFVYTMCKSLKELNIFGTIRDDCMPILQKMLPKKLQLNISPYSSVARPTVGARRTSIWGHRVRDE
ncbi:unnamed protein product [Soboliphyme baturini]|uniref:F-box domain-containing protein n=1 Tax=Soboliphyme baturini TaxID=241478 RepID=A0A183IEP2_9BILA|nr:unnamed protein product [Soboliphyme baturini]